MTNKKPAPEKKPKMSEDTINVFEDIIEKVNQTVNKEYEKMFKSLGVRKFISEKMMKDGGDKDAVENFKLFDMTPREMLQEFGCMFYISPEILDTTTNRPVKGGAFFLRQKNVVNFDLSETVRKIHLDGLRDAHKKYPENEDIKKALDASEKYEKELTQTKDGSN